MLIFVYFFVKVAKVNEKPHCPSITKKN